jgi:hypothetical protein
MIVKNSGLEGGPENGPENGPETGPETGLESGAHPEESARPSQAVFLERQSYRRRRLVDIARLLPLLGVLLLLVPLLWPGSDHGAVEAGKVTAKPMSEAITYIFAVWAILIFGSRLFGVVARRWGEDEQRPHLGQG